MSPDIFTMSRESLEELALALCSPEISRDLKDTMYESSDEELITLILNVANDLKGEADQDCQRAELSGPSSM